MIGPKVEPARPDDLGAIETLLASCDLPLDGLRDTRFFVIRKGADVIACSGLEVHGSSCVLRSLAVAKESRGQGLGHLLLRSILESARESGCTDAYLLTSTIESVAAGYGFRAIERDEVPEEALRSREFAISACARATIMHRRVEDEPSGG